MVHGGGCGGCVGVGGVSGDGVSGSDGGVARCEDNEECCKQEPR